MSSSELLVSLAAIRNLTTYCKKRDIEFTIKTTNEKIMYSTSPSNPSKTR